MSGINNNEEELPLTELHCHILPEIDDGPKDAETSLQLIKTEYDSGVRNVAFTSHFNCEKTALDEFVKKRERSKRLLLTAIGRSGTDLPGMKFKLASEVFFSPNLAEVDISKLCIEGTQFMLMELPTDREPAYLEETIYKIQTRGVTPIIAHIERYPYIMDDITQVCDWIENDVYTQVNSGTIIKNDKMGKLCRKMIEWNLVHIISSDTHSPDRRPPNLGEGFSTIRSKLGEGEADKLKQNAYDIFNGKTPDVYDFHYPKKRFGRWV